MPTAPLPRFAMDSTTQLHPDDGASGFMPTMVPAFSQEAPAQRQCGRCRKLFEGDPALHPTALPEWWLCPPCRIALLGDDRTVGAHRAH